MPTIWKCVELFNPAAPRGVYWVNEFGSDAIGSTISHPCDFRPTDRQTDRCKGFEYNPLNLKLWNPHLHQRMALPTVWWRTWTFQHLWLAFQTYLLRTPRDRLLWLKTLVRIHRCFTKHCADTLNRPQPTHQCWFPPVIFVAIKTPTVCFNEWQFV